MHQSVVATITRDVIAKKIVAFNQNTTGTKVLIADYYLQKGGLKLIVQFNGKQSDYIKMEPVTN